MSIDPHITLIGLLVGTLIGLTGIGGGSILAPLLVLVVGVSPSIAVGTDLLYSVPTKLLAFGLHARQGSVDWSVTRRLLAGGVPGALLGLGTYRILHAHMSTHALESTLRHAIGITILASCMGAAYMWAFRARQRDRESAITAGDRTPTVIAIGALVGFLVSLTSIGSGSITLPLLALTLPAITLRRLIGSEIAFAAFLIPISAAGQASFGNVDTHLALALLVGSLPGVWIGSKLCAAIDGIWLRPIVVGALAFAGSRLV